MDSFIYLLFSLSPFDCLCLGLVRLIVEGSVHRAFMKPIICAIPYVAGRTRTHWLNDTTSIITSITSESKIIQFVQPTPASRPLPQPFRTANMPYR